MQNFRDNQLRASHSIHVFGNREKPSKLSSLELSSLSSDILLNQPSGNNVDTYLMTHEGSPLLSPDLNESEALIQTRNKIDNSNTQDVSQDKYQETKSLWYMILLTIGIGGLQLAWSVELSYGTPYLISLGLSKSLMALVWIAGPLSGALVQPYVGMLSDNCRSSWGKRAPFIIIGSVATIVSLLALAWVKEIVVGFLEFWGINPMSYGAKNCIIVLAVVFVYILDFSINTVQAGLRAFILDCAPSHQQETANSMASRVIGVGNIIGYVAGYIDLRRFMWFFGNTQFKILCVNASLILSITVLLSLSTIRERDPRLEIQSKPKQKGLLSFFRAVFTSIKRLPPLTRKVCEVQFFAWIGIFPQLFYSSSYIGDIYVQPYLKDNSHMSPAELDQLYEKATRVGTFALLIYAITSLVTNLFLPFFIAPSYDSSMGFLTIPGFTLRRAWLISHLIFSACMLSTVIVRSIGAATTLIGIVGISWALSLWAPFAIISAEVSKLNKLRRSKKHKNATLQADSDNIQTGTNSSIERNEDQAGVILGIHNMSIATPQIIATLESSIIFKIFQKPRGTPGDKSFSVALAAGSLCTLFAAWLISRMEDKISFSNEENSVQEPNKDQPEGV